MFSDVSEVLTGGKSISHFGSNASEVLRQSLKVDYIRYMVVQLRMQRYLDSEPIRLFEDPLFSRDVKGNSTIRHNLAGVYNDPSSARSARLIRPLSVIEHFRPLSLINRHQGALTDIDVENSCKILSIGPRTEAEILMLWSYGFKLENISAVDLISYSPLIELADMHSLPYPDNSFDVIISSCTLVYSIKVVQAIDEIKRVAKPGATFAFMAHVSDPDYIKNTCDVTKIDIVSKNSIADALFPLKNYEILYTNFVANNISQPQGTSSSCIFREL